MKEGTAGPGSSRSIETRVLKAAGTAELYLTAAPVSSPRGLEEQARRVYTVIRDELSAAGGRLLSERLFAAEDAIGAVEAIRDDVLRDFEDGVPPTRIVVSPSPSTGRFAGAQVHAIAGGDLPTAVRCSSRGDGTAARLVCSNGHRWLFVNGMGGPGGTGSTAGTAGTILVDKAKEAHRMFYCAGCLLNQAGASMKSVPRTWLWLKDICQWYGDFNLARSSFFQRAGLIDPGTRTRRLPASTGIGLHVPGGAACTLDLIALPGREDEIQLIEASGDQGSAFEYGSAFSRASVAPMPGGKTVFISGTAAIDEAGRTEHADRIDAQIDATISHLRSLLSALGCADEHVLTALAYCKSAEVERRFRDRWSDLTWPRLTMLGDVCRSDLLFEVEVTASPELVA
jgi:enamine deaminase RidA (YjgF/YER057c/UK114 family)